LQGILFVLHTGIGWEDLPQELGFGSGMTLLAPAAPLDHSRRLRPDTPDTAGETEHGEPDRLVASGDGRQLHRRERGCRNRAVTGQPRQTRLQAPSDLRRQRHPRSRCSPLAWTCPTSAEPSTCSTATHPSPAAQAGPGAASPLCWPTRDTAAKPSARPAASAAPNRSSRSRRHRASRPGQAALRRRTDLRCCTSSDVWPCAGNAASTSTTASSVSPAPWSAGVAW